MRVTSSYQPLTYPILCVSFLHDALSFVAEIAVLYDTARCVRRSSQVSGPTTSNIVGITTSATTTTTAAGVCTEYGVVMVVVIWYDDDDGITRHNSADEIGYLVLLFPW